MILFWCCRDSEIPFHECCYEPLWIFMMLRVLEMNGNGSDMGKRNLVKYQIIDYDSTVHIVSSSIL